MREKQMRENEKLVPCPIARSSNNDAYNDICNVTGQPSPYFVDEGMSVCKSKIKCLRYFSKRLGKVNFKEIVTLIFSDTKTAKKEHRKYTNTIRHSRHAHTDEAEHASVDENDFMEGLADALKNHEVSKNEVVQKKIKEENDMSAIEKYKKKM